MAKLSQLVEDFYGKDPIRGEDALLELLKDRGVSAIEAIVPHDDSPPGSTSLLTRS
jgi:hypothetical protein